MRYRLVNKAGVIVRDAPLTTDEIPETILEPNKDDSSRELDITYRRIGVADNYAVYKES